jgi:hypothetical protein
MSDKATDFVARVVGLLIIVIFLLLFLYPVWAQENRHALGHHDYQDWASKKTNNCCNNDDCHYLAEDEFRETQEGTELKIGNKWCPVKDEHFVIKGKSPDWSKLHACINMSASYGDECDRILCFMRDGGL